MNIFDSIFKPATSENRMWNLFKTFFQTSIFWALFLWLLPKGILELSENFKFTLFEPSPILGWIFFAGFSLIGISSGVTMSWIGRGTPLPTDCPNQLVVRGPYKFVRNPMAVAGIGQGVSVGLIWGSSIIIIYALLGALLWHFFVRPSEEQDLEKRFGDSFSKYKKSVKCWMPKF